MTSQLSWGEGGLWPRDFPSSFVLAGDYGHGSGATHDKGCGAKGCGMDKTRKERNCPRQEKSLSYVKLFLLSQNIHVIYRSDITFVLGVRVGFGPGISLHILSLQVTMVMVLELLMTKVVEPKVVEWTRLGRKEIVPDKKKV